MLLRQMFNRNSGSNCIFLRCGPRYRKAKSLLQGIKNGYDMLAIGDFEYAVAVDIGNYGPFQNDRHFVGLPSPDPGLPFSRSRFFQSVDMSCPEIVMALF